MDEAEFDKALELVKEVELSDAEKKKLNERIKLRQAVSKEFASGHHNKAAKLVEKLSKDDPFKIDVLESVENIKEASKDKSVRPARQPKEIKIEEVMKKWDALIDVLTRYLAQQRRLARAWRHINQVLTIVTQHMKRFKRNLPT